MPSHPRNRPQPIQALFEFLDGHKAINLEIQRGYVAEALSPKQVEQRALLLMQHVLNTQSQPKLDPIARFLQAAVASGALGSCRDFRKWLEKRTGKSDMREALESWRGWGPKTSALFVRNLAIIESTPALRKHFWTDVDVLQRNELELPVDAVILEIFARLGPLAGKKLGGYRAINRYLRSELGYSAREMLVWDDLWFWGFITQRSSPQSQGGGRTLGWNEGKYWSIPHAPKGRVEIKQVQQLSYEFLALLKPGAASYGRQARARVA
jgi:hypothetical protein